MSAVCYTINAETDPGNTSKAESCSDSEDSDDVIVYRNNSDYFVEPSPNPRIVNKGSIIKVKGSKVKVTNDAIKVKSKSRVGPIKQSAETSKVNHASIVNRPASTAKISSFTSSVSANLSTASADDGKDIPVDVDVTIPGVSVIKLFTVVIKNNSNKLECL